MPKSSFRSRLPVPPSVAFAWHERDGAFVRLLSGESVPRKQVVSHVPLADLVEEGFGAAPPRYPVDVNGSWSLPRKPKTVVVLGSTCLP